MQPNSTPWVDRVLNAYHDAIVTVAPPDGLPEIESEKRGKLVFAEHGCGSYGCVMPVAGAGMVFKVTTDPSEAAFVRAALEIGRFPSGIVHYHAIYQLKGASHMKRPVFVLWRQEVEPDYLVAPGGWFLKDEFRGDTSAYLRNAIESAKVVRAWSQRKGSFVVRKDLLQWAEDEAPAHTDYITTHPGDWHRLGKHDLPWLFGVYRGEKRAALAFAMYAEILEHMRHNDPYIYAVAHAMQFYLSYGIVLADVHASNVGLGETDEFGETGIISDPGHAVFLDDRYNKLAIPELG